MNAFLWQMVDDSYNTIPDYFPSAISHMLPSNLILRSLLINKFVRSFPYRLTYESLLLFQVALHLYRHAVITILYSLFLS